MKSLICIAVLIASAVQYVHGQLTIECYECDSSRTDSCSDPFDVEDIDPKIQNCNGIDPFCFKTICPDGTDIQHTIRGCHNENPFDSPDYCSGELISDSCVCEVCKHGRCNAASQLSISLLALFVISLVVIRNC